MSGVAAIFVMAMVYGHDMCQQGLRTIATSKHEVEKFNAGSETNGDERI